MSGASQRGVATKAVQAAVAATSQGSTARELDLPPSSSKNPKSKDGGTIASVFASLSGEGEAILPERFAELKRSIIRSPQRAQLLKKAFDEVLVSLDSELNKVIQHGNRLVPQIQYPGDEAANLPVHKWLDAEQLRAVKKRGSVIVKGVIPEQTALVWKEHIRDYVRANPSTRGFPDDNPQVFELYWSRAQLAARSHPSFLATSRAFLSLFHAPAQKTRSTSASAQPPTSLTASIRTPLTYADRLRIRLPGDSAFALGPHIDGGGIERWECPSFRGCWSKVLGPSEGGDLDVNQSQRLAWEEHDSWSLGPNGERLSARTDMYDGPGQCGVFRPWQGWLSMSRTAPSEGTLKVLPLLKETTAYIVLRPFFKSIMQPGDVAAKNADGSWSSAYLSPENWKLDTESSDFPGCTLGRNIELNGNTHPHLKLDRSMLSIPEVGPGDVALWHCDLVHAVEAQHTGAPGKDSSVMYIPAIPLTKMNAQYVASQANAFRAGIPPSDFPGGAGETSFVGRGRPEEVKGEEARAAMGLGPIAIRKDMGHAELELVREANALFANAAKS
ncbi:DUF1479-domain-containing protein [Ceraceosorus guamensis]|uniref:DUF1479-domain-containing protein n=1 Tax=Ceraceosorus guamensis TaxID=1522189 RepID=A0A316W2X9_9BASI|nr:DUF1479-domain-containing protein [Ceraceosorus guamensis]PWN42015.1 DUF1479-domain-containing protein [Ceraceosorus guamensis]